MTDPTGVFTADGDAADRKLSQCPELPLQFCGDRWYPTTLGYNPFAEVPTCTTPGKDSDADFIIVSEQIRSRWEFIHTVRPHQVRIFWGGEALFPDLNIFDYAFGFEEMACSDRYLRLHPLVRFASYSPRAEEGRAHPRQGRERREFCDFIYSNPRAHPMRDRLFHCLSTYRQVSSFGRHLNNQGDQFIRTEWNSTWRDETVTLHSRHKFSIACENELHSGYTSEKLISVLHGGGIPIYWGNPDVLKEFNPNRILSVHSFANLDSLLDRVRQLDSDADSYAAMISEPWQSEHQRNAVRQNQEDLDNRVQRILDSPGPEGIRRARGATQEKYERQWISAVKWEYRKQRMKKVAPLSLRVAAGNLFRPKAMV